jgi:hypothetical protein
MSSWFYLILDTVVKRSKAFIEISITKSKIVSIQMKRVIVNITKNIANTSTKMIKANSKISFQANNSKLAFIIINVGLQ